MEPHACSIKAKFCILSDGIASSSLISCVFHGRSTLSEGTQHSVCLCCAAEQIWEPKSRTLDHVSLQTESLSTFVVSGNKPKLCIEHRHHSHFCLLDHKTFFLCPKSVYNVLQQCQRQTRSPLVFHLTGLISQMTCRCAKGTKSRFEN